MVPCSTMPARLHWRRAPGTQSLATDMALGRPLHIASRPGTDHDNPYFDLLYRALAAFNIEHRGLFQLNDDWLRKNAADIDAVHIHWPEYLWRVDERATFRQVGGVIRYLRLAHRLGLQRVWTVHNLPPHESTPLDLASLWILSREIDVFVCHTKNVARRVRRWLRPPAASEFVTMPIGNYDGAYPPPSHTHALAQKFGIPAGKTIIAILGRLRPYKGLDTAVRAARLLPPWLHVVVAGRPSGDFTSVRRAAATADDRITLIERDLSNQEVSDLLQLAALVWLPYRRITTSAALLLALSASRGVVATDLPFFDEILSRSPDAGRLVAVGDAHALAESTIEYLKLPPERRSRAARALADEFQWSSGVGDFATVLRRRIEQTRPR